jgi:hypothetical protein
LNLGDIEANLDRAILIHVYLLNDLMKQQLQDLLIIKCHVVLTTQFVSKRHGIVLPCLFAFQERIFSSAFCWHTKRGADTPILDRKMPIGFERQNVIGIVK